MNSVNYFFEGPIILLGSTRLSNSSDSRYPNCSADSFKEIFFLYEFFATSGIPTTFIVNSDGEVIVKDLGTAFWNDESVFKFIDNLIGKNEI